MFLILLFSRKCNKSFLALYISKTKKKIGKVLQEDLKLAVNSTNLALEISVELRLERVRILKPFKKRWKKRKWFRLSKAA